MTHDLCKPMDYKLAMFTKEHGFKHNVCNVVVRITSLTGSGGGSIDLPSCSSYTNYL